MKNYFNCDFDLNDKDIVNTYDELPLWAAPFGMKLLDKISYNKNMEVLDLGCGVGFPLIEVAQRLGNTSKVYGLDIWEAALKQIEYKVKIYGIDNIVCVKGDGKNIPFTDNKFNLIISNNGINNTANEELTIKECYRVCKENGSFIFTFNLPDTMKEFYEIYRNVLNENEMADKVSLLNQHIIKHRKDIDTMKEYLVDAGFTIEEVETDSFNLRFCDGSAMLNYHFIKLCFLKPWLDIIEENEVENIFNLLESSLNRYSELNGGLSLTIPFACIKCRK